MLNFVVPALLQTDDYLDLLGEARLPGLDMLLARGRRETLGCASLEELLCQEQGIVRQQDWPIAPITLANAGGQPGKDYWLRADPVHLRIERDRLILTEIPAPAPDEAKMLCDALTAHFGDNFSPHPLRPDAWVVRTTQIPDITTTPLSLVAGQHIDPLLPAGGDAQHWRTLLNEVQMLLFHHPVNQAREQRGKPVINSVWIWGGGGLPEVTEKSRRVILCDHADWLGLAEYSGADARTLPDKWSSQVPGDALIILDEPHRRVRQGDFNGWLTTMQKFENNWVQPLLASGRTFRIDDPLQGSSLLWRSAYRWKFWRRAKKTARGAFNIQAPPAESGIDAFGNRY